MEHETFYFSDFAADFLCLNKSFKELFLLTAYSSPKLPRLG